METFAERMAKRAATKALWYRNNLARKSRQQRAIKRLMETAREKAREAVKCSK
jgi:hypothetical protein